MVAQIAEDMLLLLLDNASGRPALEPDRRRRVLGAAVLLDLALACRIRPAVDGEPAPAGHLLLLAGPHLGDPVLDRALDVLARRPLEPSGAVAKAGRGVEPELLHRLAATGVIRPLQLRGKRLRHSRMWSMVDRTRVNRARAGLLAALFDRACPAPSTAAIISVLQPRDGLRALLSLNERGWRWVNDRAGDIAGGSWVDEGAAELPAVNLAVTASAVRSALA